jgi:ribonuclease VapC
VIAADSSALVAIALEEPEAEAFDEMIAAHTTLIGAPTLLETVSVLSARMPARYLVFIDALRKRSTVTIIPFEAAHLDAAIAALERYGKGRGHPAQLNLGDCLAYAVAKVHGVPLLFKGNDFAHTDLVAAAPRPALP